MRLTQQLCVMVILIFMVGSPAYTQNLHTNHDGLLPYLKSYEKAYSFFMQNRFTEAVNQLQEYSGDHENDAQFFYLLGVLQLKAKQYSAAASSFEHVVLIDPNNAGAWLDLSIASFESGNLPAAKSFLNYLEENFNPPAPVRKVIADYRQRIEAPAKKAPQAWQTSFEFMAGHDTNANNKLQASSISVTFLGERFDLLLDESLRAKADNFAQLTANTRYRRLWDSDGLEFSVAARKKSFTDSNNSSAGFSSTLNWQHASKFSLNGLAVAFDYDALGGKGLLRNFRVTGTLERAWRLCRFGVGAETEWRRYVSLSSLDANVSWGQIAGACEFKDFVRPMQIAFISRIGMDKPIVFRAGGKAQRKEVVFQVSSKLLPRLQLDLVWNFSDAYDQLGYSALLENNARRRIQRHTYRAQLLTPMQIDLDLFFRFDQNLINSNLDFFTQSGKSYSLGLQRRF